MEKPKFSFARKDQEMLGLVSKTDQKALDTWAIDCAEVSLRMQTEINRAQLSLFGLSKNVAAGIRHGTCAVG